MLQQVSAASWASDWLSASMREPGDPFSPAVVPAHPLVMTALWQGDEGNMPWGKGRGKSGIRWISLGGGCGFSHRPLPKLGVIPGLTRDPSRDGATAARWLGLGDLAACGGISRWAPACAGVTPLVWRGGSKGRAAGKYRALGSRPRVTAGGVVTVWGGEGLGHLHRSLPKRGVILGLTRDPSRDGATAAKWLGLGDLAAWGGISRWAPAFAGVTSGVRWGWSKGRAIESEEPSGQARG